MDTTAIKEARMSTVHPDIPALTEAATAALHAPSIFNAQPWRWRVTAEGTLELHPDPDRELPVVDPDHRLTTLSCGVALHHARVALAAEGRVAEVTRLPEPDHPDLLARISLTGRRIPTPADIRHYQTSLIRHTDRRPFPDRPVPAEALARLTAAATAHGAHLHVLREEDVPTLTAAVSKAQEVELADPAYRAELSRWTTADNGTNGGVPAETVTPATVRRTVPVREFSLGAGGQLPPGEGTDRGARYAILAGDNDDPGGWLRAGEAMSAVLLNAVENGLAVSPMSDVAEVPGSRAMLRGLLSGIGHPFLVLRIGVAEPAGPVPPTPRRSPKEAIQIDS